MLRKRISRWTSRQDDDPLPLCAFPDSFWHWYVDSYSRPQGFESKHTLPANTKKYNHNSLAVVQVKAMFAPELPQPSTNQVIALLKSPFTQGDPVKTYQLIRFYQLSDMGYFITNDGHERTGAPIELVGAENLENVMCYLDALLFLMFANLESFEPILFILNQHANPLVNQLLGLLRTYVNLMRLGNLITTDLTMRLCECLMKLGYTEAMSHKQQDAAPLFEFLTQTLLMPLLTFKVEIQHSGKQDDDDTKYSKERILFVSVPGETDPVKPEDTHVENSDDGDAVLLEECLEHYFNNSISVKRELQRRATMDSRYSFPGGGVPVVTEGEALLGATGPSLVPFSTGQVRVRTRSTTLSIWSISSVESKPREVMLPAWMLLRLLPFYTDDNDVQKNESTARNSREFVNRRPVLPICLKRYSFSAADQQASRSKKRIIIPPVIDLPLFVADDVDGEVGGYKLILESAVCHRGTTVSSGHFVSAVRKNTRVESESLEDSLGALWYLYDDMKKTRVVTKTFKEIFDKEWPYLLFYRLVSCSGARESSAVLSVRTSSYSPVFAPKGTKAKYWAEDALTPILSRTSVADDSKAISVSSKSAFPEADGSTISSVPTPDCMPSNPRFVDIRRRYLWYVTDTDKNYYKESAALSKSGSRNLSISFTPQFRRNSQWSESSNISGLALEEPTVHAQATDDIDLDLVRHKLESLELDQKSHKKIDHKPAEELHEEAGPEGAVSPLGGHRHLHRIFSNDKEPPSLSKKHHRKRRSEYKKDKCVIA